MWDKKYYIAWDDFERRVIVSCLTLHFPPRNKWKSAYGDNNTYGISKQHNKVRYTNLLTSGKLYGYLADLDKQAEDMFF